MVKEAAALLVGVPVMAPVVVLRLKPTGRAPEVSAYTYGVAPPEAAALDE
jgi:hypothetical protein